MVGEKSGHRWLQLLIVLSSLFLPIQAAYFQSQIFDSGVAWYGLLIAVYSGSGESGPFLRLGLTWLTGMQVVSLLVGTIWLVVALVLALWAGQPGDCIQNRTGSVLVFVTAIVIQVTTTVAANLLRPADTWESTGPLVPLPISTVIALFGALILHRRSAQLARGIPNPVV